MPPSRQAASESLQEEKKPVAAKEMTITSILKGCSKAIGEGEQDVDAF